MRSLKIYFRHFKKAGPPPPQQRPHIQSYHSLCPSRHEIIDRYITIMRIMCESMPQIVYAAPSVVRLSIFLDKFLVMMTDEQNNFLILY